MSRPVQVKVSDGGALSLSISSENVGEANYVKKVNLRRDLDQEARREGWTVFKPDSAGSTNQSIYDGSETLLRLAELIRPNGERVVVAASRTKIKRFNTSTGAWDTVGSGYSINGRRWQPVSMNGYLMLNNTVDIPQVFRVEWDAVQPMYELREVGIASVNTITENNGFLLLANIREIQADQLNTWMNGATPYGPVPDNIVNVIPWRVINGEFGQPTNWAPSFSVVMNAASSTITLPFATHAFTAGQTRVAVINGGADQGTLGGDSLHPNGVLITNIAGNVLTLEESTDTGISYPRTVQVTRFTDVSTLVTAYDLQGDGSEIITVKTLQTQAIVYRKTGIYVGRYTGLVLDALGNTTGPFAWKERYRGSNVPIWGDAVVSVRDDYHVYPSYGQRFYQYDGSYQPELHQQLDVARRVFFSTTLAADEEVWAEVNPITSEVWFMRPGVNTLAFDYVSKTCSEIDVGFNAAAYVQRPGAWTDKWFILGIVSTVSTYGRVEGQDPFVTFLRNGQPASFTLRNGLSSMTAQQRPGYPVIGDEFNEKDLVSYTPILASQSPNFKFQVQIYSTWNPNEAGAPLLNPPQDFPDPAGLNYITLFYRSIYFQVEIIGTDTRDIDFRFSSHLFEVDRLGAGGVNRRQDV